MRRRRFTKCCTKTHRAGEPSTHNNHKPIRLSRLFQYRCYCITNSICSLKLYDGSIDVMTTQKTQQPPGVLVGTTDIVGYYSSLHYQNGILIPSRRRIYLLPIAVFFRKYSCLMPTFDKQIEMLHTSGLIHMYSQIYQRLSLRHRGKHTEPKQLSMEQVGGIYIIGACAISLCLLVFFIELISLKIRCLRILFKYL